MDNPKAIVIQNLTKHYQGSFLALDNISFEVEQGDFFAFLGPNGAGKTTTINTLTGLANYETGKVEVFGFDVMREYREARKRIGIAPQEFNFDPYLSIEQILVFEAGYFGIPKKDALKRVDRLFTQFGLNDKRKQTVRRLSGGMKRKLLIARALIHDPEIIFLDEPTAGVDVELRYQLWKYFSELNQEGKTVFLTTHYLEEAEKLCNRVGIIRDGQLVALDTKDKLLKNHSGNLEQVFMKLSGMKNVFERLEK